jgi:hypothetical protein
MSKRDHNGEYRQYVVHEDNGKFVFDCFEYGPTSKDGVTACIRKQHLEFDTADEAIEEFRHYISAWEDEVVE